MKPNPYVVTVLSVDGPWDTVVFAYSAADAITIVGKGCEGRYPTPHVHSVRVPRENEAALIEEERAIFESRKP